MTCRSWRGVDWRQQHSVSLQLTTAGENATPHCRNALSSTAHNLGAPSAAQALDLVRYTRPCAIDTRHRRTQN